MSAKMKIIIAVTVVAVIAGACYWIFVYKKNEGKVDTRSTAEKIADAKTDEMFNDGVVNPELKLVK